MPAVIAFIVLLLLGATACQPENKPTDVKTSTVTVTTTVKAPPPVVSSIPTTSSAPIVVDESHRRPRVNLPKKPRKPKICKRTRWC